MDIDAARLIGLLDLTSLTGTETDADIAALCAKADGVAAVCVYGRWVARAVEELGGRIPVAAVANFPEGDLDAGRAGRDSEQAVAAGATEVDVVLPWRAWLAGDTQGPIAVVAAARAVVPGRLKVILETGSLGPAATAEAARAALDAGADFVKTSTGKVGTGATPEAAQVMLEAIRDAGHGGFKASGGVRMPGQAQEYVELAEQLLGRDWVTADNFRIGASSLLDELRNLSP